MVNVRNRTFAHEGCTNLPSFGVENGGRKNTEFCPQHAKAGIMVKFFKKTCAHEGYTNYNSSFGVEEGSKKAVFYSQHKKAGMANVSSKRCAHQACIKQSGRRQEEDGVLCSARRGWNGEPAGDEIASFSYAPSKTPRCR